MNDMCKNDNPALLKQVLEIIGDKYSALIIRMMHDDPQRFRDFEEKIDGIAPVLRPLGGIREGKLPQTRTLAEERESISIPY